MSSAHQRSSSRPRPLEWERLPYYHLCIALKPATEAQRRAPDFPAPPDGFPGYGDSPVISGAQLGDFVAAAPDKIAFKVFVGEFEPYAVVSKTPFLYQVRTGYPISKSGSSPNKTFHIAYAKFGDQGEYPLLSSDHKATYYRIEPLPLPERFYTVPIPVSADLLLAFPNATRRSLPDPESRPAKRRQTTDPA